MVVVGKKQASSCCGSSSSSSSSSLVVQAQAEVRQGEAPAISGITAAAGAGRGSGGGMRKGPWTEQEDVQLVWFVRLLGERRWDFLAKVSGLQRSGKSCRLRWVNYLHPGLKRGRMTPDEERLVIQLHANLGNRWSRIAKSMPGRTDNEIKNYWRTHLRKLKLQAHKQKQEAQQATTPSSSISDDDHNSSSSSSSSNSNHNLQQPADEESASQAQHQQQDQLFLPLWNDIVDVDCWSSTDIVAPAPMPASPLWDDAFRSDYSLPFWGSSDQDDDDYIKMLDAS